MSDIIANSRAEVIYAIEETTPGVLENPTSSGTVLVSAAVDINQQPEYFDDDQKRPSRSQSHRVRGRYPSGNAAITTWAKPSGTAGVAPETDILLKSALGRKEISGSGNETIQSGSTTTVIKVNTAANFKVGACHIFGNEYRFITAIDIVNNSLTLNNALPAVPTIGTIIPQSVNYKLADINTKNPSFSLYSKQEHTIFSAAGTVVDTLTIPISGKDMPKMTFATKFMKKSWTGTDKITTSMDATITAITPSDLQKFCIESIIKIDNELMKVTAINESAGTLTVIRGYLGSTADSHAIDAVISPYSPPTIEKGIGVHGRLGFVIFDNISIPILECEISINNKIKMYEDEKNGTDYATDYGYPESREVRLSMLLYFRRDDLKYFRTGMNQIRREIVIPVGTVSGNIVVFRMPQVELNVPAIEGELEKSLRIEAICLSTEIYDDEISMHFC